MDENNHYGNAMTEPLPTGSIKKVKKIPAMREFDLIIQEILGKDKFGHPFVVDIEFDRKNVCEKQLFFNEVYTTIFEKKIFLSANEGSVFEHLDTVKLKDKGTINSYKLPQKPMQQWIKNSPCNFMLNNYIF